MTNAHVHCGPCTWDRLAQLFTARGVPLDFIDQAAQLAGISPDSVRVWRRGSEAGKHMFPSIEHPEGLN